MKFKHIIREIENTDQRVFDQLSDRRTVLKNLGSKAALAAIPFVAGSLFNTAQAKTTATDPVVAALNVILEHKYLEYAFYRHGNNTGALIPAADQAGFQAIEAQEKGHVTLLIATITALGGVPFKPNHYTDPTTEAPYVPAAYDFTGGGAYPTVFSNYSTFLILAQVFEDTGIHAINGQIPALVGNTGVLTQVFQILTTEGRQAAFVRLVRRLSPAISPEYPAPWITNNIPPIAAFQPFYLSEDNVEHKSIVITSLPDTHASGGTVPQISATGAFDEGYDATKIKTLMSPYKLL